MSRLTRWKSPPNAESSTDFRYPQLISAKTGIRLAILQPASGNKAISIQLIDSYVTGAGRTEYDALSYVWSTSQRDKIIFCNGKRLFVTKTLIEALSRFRRRNEAVTLWIDQICICQERLLERNAQVQMMGDIFRAARKVIVWLGDDYDDSKAGMQLAQQLLHIAKHRQTEIQTADLEVHGLPKQNSKRWKALAAILRRPWFWRTWIVQEVVLNANVDLVLGANSLSWDELGQIVALLEGPLPLVFQLDQAITAFELPFTKINRIRMRHQGRMPESRPVSRRTLSDDQMLVAEPDDMLADDPDLLDLLLMSRSLGATDPRDKIYALLGIGKHNIETDYSLSPEVLFNDFALSIIGEATLLVASRAAQKMEATADDKEVRKVMILLACAGKQNQSLSLPSWVPDWTTDITSRPLIFSVGQNFNAGGHELGVLDWTPDAGLQLSGVLFDTIQSAGTVKLDWQGTEMTTETHSLIQQWWAEATQIATARNVRSPGSTFNLDAFTNLRRALSICRHGYYTGSGNGRRRQSLLDEEELTTNDEHSALHTMTLGPTRGRVLIVTAMGYVGLAPHGAQEGDVVFVILGSDIPFLLRHKADAYELIGEVYLQGIMYGEALSMDNALGIQEISVW